MYPYVIRHPATFKTKSCRSPHASPWVGTFTFNPSKYGNLGSGSLKEPHLLDHNSTTQESLSVERSVPWQLDADSMGHSIKHVSIGLSISLFPSTLLLLNLFFPFRLVVDKCLNEGERAEPLTGKGQPIRATRDATACCVPGSLACLPEQGRAFRYLLLGN